MGDKIVIKYVHLKKPARVIEKDGTCWLLDRTPPVGVVIATSAEDIGWSLCAINKGDSFKKKVARELALDRASAMLNEKRQLPKNLTAVQRTDLYEVYEQVKAIAKEVFAPEA